MFLLSLFSSFFFFRLVLSISFHFCPLLSPSTLVVALINSSAASARTITEIEFLITYFRVPVSYFCGISFLRRSENAARLLLSSTINLVAVTAQNFSGNPQTLITPSLLLCLAYPILGNSRILKNDLREYMSGKLAYLKWQYIFL